MKRTVTDILIGLGFILGCALGLTLLMWLLCLLVSTFLASIISFASWDNHYSSFYNAMIYWEFITFRVWIMIGGFCGVLLVKSFMNDLKRSREN